MKFIRAKTSVKFSFQSKELPVNVNPLVIISNFHLHLVEKRIKENRY